MYLVIGDKNRIGERQHIIPGFGRPVKGIDRVCHLFQSRVDAVTEFLRLH